MYIVMETRIIEGHYNYSEYSLYRPCFLCNVITCNYYYSKQKDDKNIRYKIYLCQYCQNFQGKINPEMYSISIQNYIRSKWKDTNIKKDKPINEFYDIEL